MVNKCFRLFFEIVVKDDERENQTMETKDCGGAPVIYMKKKDGVVGDVTQWQALECEAPYEFMVTLMLIIIYIVNTCVKKKLQN